ncbi:MAG TPA: DNA-3-methyladenine glycosylase [Gemmatimonadales bacterium]|nr:DNA-3-methyladenine glycosylase [Gemmatimonadales bacterium]
MTRLAARNGLCYDSDIAVRHLTDADPKLGALIERAGPFTMQPQPTQSIFGALARSIVYQQLSGKAAATILGRVTDLFPRRKLTPEELLALRPEQLRGAGISANKLAALQDLAELTLDGTVPTLRKIRTLSDDEIIERLTQVRGIGRWTVEMLLIFRLGRPDVLPVGDLGVRKGFAHTYRHRKLPDAARMTRVAERWRPYRSVGSWYMWRAVDLERDGKTG